MRDQHDAVEMYYELLSFLCKYIFNLVKVKFHLPVCHPQSCSRFTDNATFVTNE